MTSLPQSWSSTVDDAIPVADDLHRALAGLHGVCQQLGLRMQIGGSVATSVYGVARSTLDIDVVIDLPVSAVPRFVDALEQHYYVDLDAVRVAASSRASFNLIHEETVIKIDVFVPPVAGFGRASFEREVRDTLTEESNATVFSFATPEDMILHKLTWFELGERVSERQWNDVVGVIRVNRSGLDWSYIERWAEQLGVSELLKEARSLA